MDKWSKEDLHVLWKPARKNIYPSINDYGLVCEEQVNKMKVLIGLDPHRYLQGQALTDEQRNLLRMLAGPHGKAIAKAIEIKRSATNGLATETGVSSYDQAKAEQA